MPWRACSEIPSQSGRGSGWLWGLPATLILRRYRLSGGDPINHQAGLHFDSPSKLFHIVPCTHAVGGAPAASGIAGPTSPRIWEQAWRLLQMWQRWPLCLRVSLEPASIVCSTISELQASQADHDQEKGASQLIWTGEFYRC